MALAVVIGMSASPLEGQTRFALRDTLPDLSRYQTVDDCRAVVDRLMRRFDLARPYWADTMVSKERDRMAALPSGIVPAAQECVAKFHPDSVDLSEYSEWMTLYLMADRDADAEIVANRRLATASDSMGDSVNGRVAILWKLAGVYGGAQPGRVPRMLAMVNQIAALDSASWKTMLRVYSVRMGIAKEMHDTTTRTQIAMKILGLMNALSDEDVSSLYYKSQGSLMVLGAMEYLDRLTLLDSLRSSSEAYVALRMKHRELARADTQKDLPMLLGKMAPALTGDFWFAPPSQTTVRNISDELRVTGTPVASVAPMTRPQPGKVSLVVFLYGGCRTEVIWRDPRVSRQNFGGSSCWGAYSAIRRFVERYPALDVTIVSQTTGYVAETQPLSPELEAQLLRSWWLEFHRLPATLVISNPTHFKLSQPDGRRIDAPTPNTLGYVFGVGASVGNTQAYLVDVNGMILHAEPLNSPSERRFGELLDVVMNREQRLSGR